MYFCNFVSWQQSQIRHLKILNNVTCFSKYLILLSAMKTTWSIGQFEPLSSVLCFVKHLVWVCQNISPLSPFSFLFVICSILAMISSEQELFLILCLHDASHNRSLMLVWTLPWMSYWSPLGTLGRIFFPLCQTELCQALCLLACSLTGLAASQQPRDAEATWSL